MAWNVFQYCTGLKIVGSIMILVVLGIVGVTYYSLVISAYFPMLLEGGIHLVFPLSVLLIFHGLLAMLLWSYFATVFTDPGGVPPGWQPYSEEDEMEAQTSQTIQKNDALVSSKEDTPLIVPHSGSVGGSEDGSSRPRITVRKCGKCGELKPPRAHHCSVCQKCVLKMDHHCVWVVNCVGAKNYKFFILFLVYTFLENTLTSIALFPAFLQFFSDDINNVNPTEMATTFLSFVLNLAFSLSLLGFLFMHSRFVMNNTTTIEAFEKRAGNRWRYDMGKRKNFEQVFGSDPHYWFLPLYSSEDLKRMPVLQGLDYPCFTDVETVIL